MQCVLDIANRIIRNANKSGETPTNTNQEVWRPEGNTIVTLLAWFKFLTFQWFYGIIIYFCACCVVETHRKTTQKCFIIAVQMATDILAPLT